MGKRFVSLISNDRFQIACTGQTVYVMDPSGRELAKFRDMTYAYYPALHPQGDTAAVFSNNGIMAVYSLSELRLIAKFRVSAEHHTQTDRIPCFSPDGQYLYHIENRKDDSLNSRLSVYSTVDYQPVLRLFEQGQKTVFSCMEFDQETGILFLLGYHRQENGNDYFVAKLNGRSLQDVRLLDRYTYDFYQSAVHLKQMGFTEFAYKWSNFASMPRIKTDIERKKEHPVDMGPFDRTYTLDVLKKMKLSLPGFWAEAEDHTDLKRNHALQEHTSAPPALSHSVFDQRNREMRFYEKDWLTIVEECLTEEPYAVNRCFSELSLIPEDGSLDDRFQQAYQRIEPSNRRYSRFPDCLSPFGYADPVIDDSALKKYYHKQCKEPKFIYDYDSDHDLVMIERVGMQLSIHFKCHGLDFYIGRDEPAGKYSRVYYVTIAAANRFHTDYLKISTSWSVGAHLYLVDGFVSTLYISETQRRSVDNKYIFADQPFPRFATEPFHGAKIRMITIKNTVDGQEQHSRDIYPFMVFLERKSKFWPPRIDRS